jgi:hypothetical protein
VKMLRNLFASILSSNRSNSWHFWILLAWSCPVNWLGIQRKWNNFIPSESRK